jgi:hypothetical protein
MASKMPELKRRVNAFLVGEEGKISKDSILKAGALLGAVGISSVAMAGSAVAQSHTNSISGSFDPSTITVSGTHGHHSSHSSHGSHGSHGSHCSGGWCD